ncbi:unnamed protein product [Adineta ricciae]|uniref:Fork-head domain-containing protein n=1 Tax=Adineta ricciae TaxID=249248 RepID=A0A814IJL1_ADIRI|nr:unnamed protein product [Adineta ricciae]
MTQWPFPRNVYTLSSMNKSSETTHILTTHNTNTPARNSPTIFDDSLTNLSWLHDINILKRTIPTINSGTNSLNNKRKDQCVSTVHSSSSGALHPNDIDDNHHHSNVDDDHWKVYRNNPHMKPVYSYSQLILLAMKNSGHEKMSLDMICEWLVENFPYMKKMEATWQNSIRINLSDNKYFMKVSRKKKESGEKGAFYKLSLDQQRQLVQEQPTIKRLRSSKRSAKQSNHTIKSEVWIDSVLPCIASKSSTSTNPHDRTYVRMPSSFLSPISSPDSLTVPPFHQQQQQQSNSSSPSSLSSAISKQNFIPTKLDDADMLLLDSVTFDWDAYLCETPNDIDLSTKTEQDLFNDFNAALTDLTYSAEIAAAGGDTSAFDGFDCSSKHSTFSSLFEDDEQALKIKGRGIKRPLWWLTNDNITSNKLPSLEAAFDLKLPK